MIVTTCFIKLHCNGEPVIIPVDQISSVYNTENGTLITLKNTISIHIDESVEEVYCKLPH